MQLMVTTREKIYKYNLVLKLTVFSLCVLSDNNDVDAPVSGLDSWLTTTPNNISKQI